MDILTAYHGVIESIVQASGVSDKLVHVHAGLAIYVSAKFVLRDRRASGIALGLVFGAEMANEAMDAMYFGSWRWADTLGDVIATVFWPTTDFLVSKVRRARWATDQARRSKARARTRAMIGGKISYERP